MKRIALVWIAAALLSAACLPAVRGLFAGDELVGPDPGVPSDPEVALGRLVAAVLDLAPPAEAEVWAVAAASPEHVGLASDLRAHPPTWYPSARLTWAAPELADSGSSYARAAALGRELSRLDRLRRAGGCSEEEYASLLDGCVELAAAEWDDHRPDYARALARYLAWRGASPLLQASSLARLHHQYRGSDPYRALQSHLGWISRFPPLPADSPAVGALGTRTFDVSVELAARLVPLENARAAMSRQLGQIASRTSQRSSEPWQLLLLLGRLLAVSALALVAGLVLARSALRIGVAAPPPLRAGGVILGFLALALVGTTVPSLWQDFDLGDRRLAQGLLLACALAFAGRRRMAPWRRQPEGSRRARFLQALPYALLALALAAGFHEFMDAGSQASSKLLERWPLAWAIVCGASILVVAAAWARPRDQGVARLRRLFLALTVLATLAVSASGIARGTGEDFLVSPLASLAWLALWLVGTWVLTRAYGRRGYRTLAVSDWPLAVILLSLACLVTLASRVAFGWPSSIWTSLWVSFEEYSLVDITALLCLVPILRSAWDSSTADDGKPTAEALGRTLATTRSLAQGALILAIVVAAETAYGYRVMGQAAKQLQDIADAGF